MAAEKGQKARELSVPGGLGNGAPKLRVGWLPHDAPDLVGRAMALVPLDV